MNEKYESKKALRVLYTIFLAGLITLFFGLGVAAFYPQPKSPEWPAILEGKTEPFVQNEDQKQAELEFQKQEKEFRTTIADYNRNVSIIIFGFAVIALVASLVLSGRIDIIPNGLMLGSVFLLIYSIGRGFGTEDARFRFVITALGLAVTLVIGYLKFMKKEHDVSK